MHETMSILGLARLVKEMREAQRAYFKSPQRETLVRSKGLEARVDAAVKEVLEPGLFGEDEPK